MMSSHLSVLRMGPFPDDNDCAKQLKSVLISYFHQRTTLGDSSIIAPTGERISIANRYFTAQVLFAEIGVQTSPSLAGNDSSEAKAISEDGVILVFDAELSHPKFATSMSASFDSMESIHDAAVASDTAGDLLRLCVGIGDSRMARNASTTADRLLSEKEYEQEYSRRVLWCLDRGYEYVEVLDLSEESVRQGHDVRDKEGFARIVEAISGTVWTSAVMEPKKQQELQESFKETRSDFVPSDVNGETSDDSIRLNLYEPPDPSILLSGTANVDELDEQREQKARSALLAGAAELIDSEQLNNDLSDNRERRKEMEEERSLQALESSLREARRIRELSQSGQLSDEDRRQRAADAAMVIMDAMEKMGMYDDDDDDEDSEGGDVDNIEVIEDSSCLDSEK